MNIIEKLLLKKGYSVIRTYDLDILKEKAKVNESKLNDLREKIKSSADVLTWYENQFVKLRESEEKYKKAYADELQKRLELAEYVKKLESNETD